MPWQVPITVDGLEYPVTFNTEGEPTQQDYDEAVQQILSQKAQAAPEPEPETPGYLSQLGSALGLGYRQMKSGVGATFNALTGDTADVAAEMAEMSKLQREQQATQTPEDVEFIRSLEEAEKGFEQAQGPIESIGALAQYPAAVFAQPGAAFKTAVQSAPNALISGATSLAGYGLGGLVGGVAGIETGPGAILTGLAGATAGGALSNTLMEAGPSIFDVLNERTQGAASNMTADEIAAYLQQNPDIVDEGLKTGAIRGSVIGAVEALGVKGSGRLLTMPERAAARAVQKELMAQGVDVASKEAVDKALLDPALRASTKAAAETAKNQFSSAGNMARLAGASAIETGAAGAGELAAQAAAGQDISTKEAFLEMMGDAALSLPMAATTKAFEGAKYMLNPALVSDLGKASAENLAATGSTAAAEAQEGFNEAIELAMLPFTREDIRGISTSAQVAEDAEAEVTPLSEGAVSAGAGLNLESALIAKQERESSGGTTGAWKLVAEDEPPVQSGFVRFYHAGDPVISKGDRRWLSPDRAWVSGFRPGLPVSFVDVPVSDPQLKKSFDDSGTPMSSPFVNFEADEQTTAKLQPLSAGLQAAIPQQPVETQEDAAPEIPLEESVREEPQDRVESREAEETGAGDQLLRPAEGEGEGEVAPIEPTVENIEVATPYVTGNGGQRGEIQSENGDDITVEWRDGTTTTVKKSEVVPRTAIEQTIKNKTQISQTSTSSSDKFTVFYYDENGEVHNIGSFLGETEDSRDRAFEKALALAEKNAREHNHANVYYREKKLPVKKSPSTPQAPTSATTPTERAATGEAQKEPITPQGTPTTATEGMVTPGGVASPGVAAEAQPEQAAAKEKAPTEPSESTLSIAKRFGGRIAWSQGDLAIIEGFQLFGSKSLYVAVVGDRYSLTDFTLMKPEQRKALLGDNEELFLRKREEIVEANNRMLAQNPDGPFTNGQTVVVSKNVPQNVASVFREWVRLLGLNAPTRIVLTTPQDGIDMAAKYGGKYRRIGVTSLMSDNERGQMTPLGEDDFHIFYKEDTSYARTLEVLAHELGHILERQSFKNLPDDQRKAIIAEHEKWLKRVGSQKALDGIRELRSMRVGRIQPNVDRADERFEELNAYWKSFSEWFADQVARWATTTDKPLTVVEKFFARLGKKLREFFNLKGSQFAPNQRIADWLNSLSPDLNAVVEETLAPAEIATKDSTPAVRDTSKPEQMTPLEYMRKAVGAKFVESVAPGKEETWWSAKEKQQAPRRYAAGTKMVLEENGRFFVLDLNTNKYKSFGSKREAFLFFKAKDGYLERRYIEALSGKKLDPLSRIDHKIAVDNAVKNTSPVSAETVDTYGIKLPEGYVKQGDLYVFQPQTKAAEKQVKQTSPKKTKPAKLDESKAIAEYPDLETFFEREVLPSGKKGGWVLKEKRTGARLSSGKTKEEASADFRKSLLWQQAWNEEYPSVFEMVNKLIEDKSINAEKYSQSYKVKPSKEEWLSILEGRLAELRQDREDTIKQNRSVGARPNTEFVDNFIANVEARLAKLQTTAAEKQTPVPLREGTGAAGVVQSEPVEGSIPTDEKVSPETESESSEKLDPKLVEAKQKQAKEEKAAAKKQEKLEQDTKSSLNSVVGPQKKNDIQGTVTKADVEAARAALTNSGEIPNAYLTNVYESREAFLADRMNSRLFPASYARLQTEKNIEGLFENGQTLVFAKEVQVSDLDRGLAKMLGVSDEQAAARRVIAHENGHKAISLFTMAEKRELRGYLMRAYSDEQVENLVKTYTEYADWRTNPESRLEALEELLMRDFEKMERIPTGGVWDEIVQFLKRVWRRLTGQKGEPTLKNLKDVVRLMRNAMKRPEVPLGSFRLKDGGDVKLSMGKPEFTSDSEAALSAGSEAARSTLYSERDMDIREAIRRAYEAMPKQNSVAVPIGELFAKTEELMPGVTQEEFSLVLQDLFEDNGAVLQEGESDFFVTTPEGRRAGFVVVMPRAAKASRIKAEGPAVSKLKEDVRNIDEGSVKADFDGRQFTDTKPNQRTVKPKQSYTDAAVEFVDSLQNEGNSLEDIAYSIQSPEFIEGLGIERDLSMQDAIGLEVRNRINNALRKEKALSVKARLNKLNLSLSKFWQGIGSVKGQHLAIRQKLIADPRYRWMFIKDKAEEAMKEARENVATANITSTDDLTNQMNREGEKADEQAAQVVADETKAAIEDDIDAQLLREGEDTLDPERRKIWDRIKDILRKLALVARAKSRRVANAAKASISKAESDAIFKMSDEELAKLEKELLGEFDKLSKAFLGEESDAKTPEQKKTRAKRKKAVDVAKKRAEAGKDIETPQEGEAESSEEQVSKAERTAQAILKDLSERYSDPLIIKEKKPNVDAMRELYKERVKQGVGPSQMTEKSFVNKAVELGVGEKTAGILWKAAELEIDAREAMRQDKILQRKAAVGARADAQAHRIIFAKERLKRQSGFSGIESNTNKDTIIKAFQEQVKTPISQDAFIARLRPLNVSETVAKRLFTAAEREKADLEAMEAFRMLEGPDALKNILREIERMRRGEEIPLRTPIPWRQLLSQKAKTVEEYRQRIFDAISANEAFQNLSDDKKAKLADLFSEAWESKRKDILERMLTNLINKEEAAKRISQKGAQALREQSQRLVEDINLGILDSDELMKRLAEKFGIKSEFTEEEKQKIDSLIDTLQDSTLNRVKRNKAAYDLLKTLSGTVKVPITKLLADLWVTNVLSGINTMTSIALAVSSGAFELTSGVLRIIKAAIANQKQLPSEISASFKSLARFLGAFPREANLAWQYLVTGDRAFLDPSMNDVLNDLNYDSIGKSVSLAERLAESDKLLEKTVGVWMRTVSRLLTALDSFNSGVTKSGAIPIVARQLELDPATLAKAEESMNLQNYKDRIIQRDFAGVAPKTAREKALVDSWAKDEMMADLDKYGEFTENADFFGQQGAMTLEPSGIGGMIYRLIKSVTGNLSAGSDRFLAESQRKWQERGKSDSMDATRLALAYALQFIAYNSANLAGLRFARFAGNKFNQGLSFIPGIGMLRLFEADLDKTHVKGKDAFMDMIQRNQFAGVMMSMVGLAILKAIADEPDDEKRGWAFNGGWANLTPERKQQKLAAGEKEYTIRVGDKVFNYQNWPISSVLAAIGGLSDLIRYSPEQWNEKSIAGRLGSAAASGVFAASEIPALSQFQELFGSNLSSKDPNEKKLDRFSRVMAGWGGGFVPRILKDFDFLAEPTLKKYDTLWERTASHIPVYRRYVGDDYYDILGKPIERKIYPGSREFMEKPSAPEYQILGKLNSRGIWLTPANAEHRMVGKGRNRRRLTQEEADAYSLETGKGYRQMLLRYGQRALQMPTERARAFLSDKADEVRDRALKKVYRGYKS